MASGLGKSCGNLSLNDSMRAILECPVCFEFCKTPIFMCSNGHHICNKCQPSLTQCPTCRADGRPTARSLPLEKMADKLLFPCANKHEGCEKVLNSEDMTKHWAICKETYAFSCLVYSPLDAACCIWKGNRRALVAHVKEAHPGCYSEVDVVQCEVSISFTEDIAYSRLVSAFKELFWVSLAYDHSSKNLINTGDIYSTYIGKKYNATKYSCKFVYSSKNGCIVTTNVVDTEYSYWDNNWGIEPFTSNLRFHKSTLEEYLSDGIFSFTAQIIKT